MTVKKSLFSRTTAFMTALLMALMTIMAIPVNSFALYDGGDAYYLESSDIKNISLQVVDSNGNIKYTLGDGDTGLRWSDGDKITMHFEWGLQTGEFVDENLNLDMDVFDQLKSGTLLRYDMGPVDGLEFETGVITDFGTNAQYWITTEGGHCYININLTENYTGGWHGMGGSCEFEGTLDYDEKPDEDFDVSIPDIGIDCTFDFSPVPAKLHIVKSAEGSVYKDEDGYYYQNFKVEIGSYFAAAENAYLEDYLGDAFEGIYDVKVDGYEADYDDSYDPIFIYIGDIAQSDDNWLSNPIYVTYRARLKDGYTFDELFSNSLDGENRIVVNADDIKPEEDTASMEILPPEVTKFGSRSDDNSSITWTITVKSNLLTGSDFTIQDVFDEVAKEYLDLDNFYATYPDGEIRVEDDGSGIYTITFTTPIKKQPQSSVAVRNDVTVTFDDYPSETYPGGDTVPIPVTVGVDKEYVTHEGNTFEWELKVAIPNDNTINKVIIQDEPYYGWEYSAQKAITTISKNGITITGSDGTVLNDFEFSYSEWGGALITITDSDFIAANIGKTIIVSCKTVVKSDKEVTFINNKVTASVESTVNKYDSAEDTAYYEKKYTTEKFATGLDGAFAPVRWLVRVSSIEGFKAGDVITVEDIIPEGYKLIDDSVKAGWTYANSNPWANDL